MIKTFITFLITSSAILISCNNLTNNDIELHTNSFALTINETGQVVSMVDIGSGENLLGTDTLAPIISIKTKEIIQHPRSVKLNNDLLEVSFNDTIEAIVKVIQKETYITFELISITHLISIDLLIWGPYPTILNDVIGETVGVVQGKKYAIGIQALNPKTLGGYPWNENDCMPQIDIFDQDDLSDMNEEGKRYVLYRVEAAKPTDFGSSLQAYCRNRDNERVVENWGHNYYTAPGYDDGGIIGSSIAIFGCPKGNILETIKEIELEEGLPHALIDGNWAKTSPLASSAYMIYSFGIDNIQDAIDLTIKSGFSYLYHPGPFETWGSFKLNKNQFPEGIKSLKGCVELAENQGVTLGLHTLSNFISTNDSLVTPIPDKRLALVGSSVISEDIDDKQTEIPILSPTYFNQYTNNHLKTVIIGDELIRYGSVSEAKPWKLLNCQRGVFNTTASSHVADSDIGKLADHGYKVFLTNSDLTKEVAENIANIFNCTGMRQISFDGLEGCRSTGMGNYGEILFTKSWYDYLNDDIKNHFIADASRTSHYFWHIYTRMNWGEPWYGGFRESQTEYRLKNQKYFKRNLMPGMLGWFKMTPETSIEDAEWLLARSAAYNAGYAFVTSESAIKLNGYSDKIMTQIGIWENARISGLFTENQKLRMEDINNEFTLRKSLDNKFILTQMHSHKFNHAKKELQPGEPHYTSISIRTDSVTRNMNFIITAVDCSIANPIMEIDNFMEINIPIVLRDGQSIKYTGGNKAIIYDNNWNIVGDVEIEESKTLLKKGNHTINFDCDFVVSSKDPKVKIEIRIAGKQETLAI